MGKHQIPKNLKLLVTVEGFDAIAEWQEPQFEAEPEKRYGVRFAVTKVKKKVAWIERTFTTVKAAGDFIKIVERFGGMVDGAPQELEAVHG